MNENLAAYIIAIIFGLCAGWFLIAALCFVFQVPLYWPGSIALAAWAGFVGYTYWGGPIDG